MDGHAPANPLRWSLPGSDRVKPERRLGAAKPPSAKSETNLRPSLAQVAEPPYADPHVRWCGRGGAARLPPIPIVGLWPFGARPGRGRESLRVTAVGPAAPPRQVRSLELRVSALRAPTGALSCGRQHYVAFRASFLLRVMISSDHSPGKRESVTREDPNAHERG